MSHKFADSSQAVSKPVCIAVCTVKKTSDDVQRNCPKHVEFYSKNKFEKLVHLVGFIIRIYHEARSPERKERSIRSTIFRLKHKVICVIHSILA